jgi:hypothetical protein
MCQIKFRDFSLFDVALKYLNCISTKCDSAANAIDRDTDIFNGRLVLVNMIG